MVVLLCLAGITIDPQIISAPVIQIEQSIADPEPERVRARRVGSF